MNTKEKLIAEIKEHSFRNNEGHRNDVWIGDVIDTINKHLSSMVIVPEEPDSFMIAAGEFADDKGADVLSIYESMINAYKESEQ